MKKKDDTSSYTEEEVAKAVEVFKMLQKKRDELIRQGLWDTVKGDPINPEDPKTSDGETSKK